MSISSIASNKSHFYKIGIANPEIKDVKKAKVKVKQISQCMPKVSFSVTDETDLFEYNSSLKKTARVGWLILSIFIFPIGLVRLIGKAINYMITKNFICPELKCNKKSLDDMRNKFMQNPTCAKICERITIATIDHVKLDTMMIHNPTQEELEIDTRKYIIYLGDGPYEKQLTNLMKISKETGATVYCGNYRGMGHSKGFPKAAQDFNMDAETMVQYLLSIGVSSKNILIHGHSKIGGQVGAHVASMHQVEANEVNFCADRTFSSMVKVVKELLLEKQRQIDRKTWQNRFKSRTIALLSPIAIRLIKGFGWNFKCFKLFKNINAYKFIIYHHQDMYRASLYKKFKDFTMTVDEKLLKIQRKEQKIKCKLEGKKYVSEKVERDYRPKNVIRLNDEIKKELAHNMLLDKTKQFDDYKAHVVAAFM